MTHVYQKILGQLYRRLGRQPEPYGIFGGSETRGDPPLSEIFAKIGLDKQNWDFRQTVEYLEFTHSDGVEMDFHFAIDVVTDLAAILLECSVSGSVNLQDLDEYNTPARRIRITATPEEHEAMDKALADFCPCPLEYDISEMMGEDEITDMASQGWRCCGRSCTKPLAATGTTM